MLVWVQCVSTVHLNCTCSVKLHNKFTLWQMAACWKEIALKNKDVLVYFQLEEY